MNREQLGKHKLQLCFFGTYPATYTVSRILERAAQDAGVSVFHCHESLAEAPLSSPDVFRPGPAVLLLARYVRTTLRLWPRLARCPAQILVAGFRGQLDVLWVSRWCRTRGRRLVFAPLVTVSETAEDRGLLRSSALAGALTAWLDRKTLSLADRVVIDTRAHADFLRCRFGVPEERIRVFYLGADPDAFRPSPLRVRSAAMRVLFYGSFLPLHGIEVIVDTARLLRGEKNIQFTLCGDGWQWREVKKVIEEAALPNVTLRGWVPYHEIAKLIQEHDVCLGIFSGKQKARMVIPNKVYQCAQVGRPVVSADTAAIREVFKHGENILLVPPENAEALAETLLQLYRQPESCRELARNAARLMSEQFSPGAQAARFWASFVDALL